LAAYKRQGGNWRYLYRAVDSTGATIDFRFSAKRDAGAAKQFFQKALQAPRKVQKPDLLEISLVCCTRPEPA
jgi:transposase-like protein